MKQEEKFVMSHKPYAVDLSSMRTTHTGTRYDGTPMATVVLDAVWIRRRGGTTVACTGTLWDIQVPPPGFALEFLAAHDDGRYGGRCAGRWDGTGYWGAERPETVAQQMALLRPMLENFPEIPDGYDGWWTFR